MYVLPETSIDNGYRTALHSNWRSEHTKDIHLHARAIWNSRYLGSCAHSKLITIPLTSWYFYIKRLLFLHAHLIHLLEFWDMKLHKTRYTIRLPGFWYTTRARFVLFLLSWVEAAKYNTNNTRYRRPFVNLIHKRYLFQYKDVKQIC